MVTAFTIGVIEYRLPSLIHESSFFYHNLLVTAHDNVFTSQYAESWSRKPGMLMLVVYVVTGRHII